MTGKDFVFKRRTDGRLILCSIIVGVLLLDVIIFAFVPDPNPDYGAGAPVNPSVLMIFLLIISVIFTIRAKSTTFVIDDTKIVKKDIFGTKEILWNDVHDVFKLTQRTNGVASTTTLNFVRQDRKVLFKVLYPTHTHYSGSGDLEDVLLSIFKSKSRERSFR